MGFSYYYSFCCVIGYTTTIYKKVILGSDSIFHYNRFYEAAMQLKMVTFLTFYLYMDSNSQAALSMLFTVLFLPIYKEGLFNKWHLVSLSDCVKGITTYTSRVLNVCLAQAV